MKIAIPSTADGWNENIDDRFGRGKGFYDRFLSECRMDVKKIGLSMFDPLDELITDFHDDDIPLDQCITPKGLQRFR